MDLVVPSYSDDDLRQIGMDADHEIQEQVEIIYDPIVSGYLNELGQELASQIEPQPFIYRFRVINARSLNAFALARRLHLHPRRNPHASRQRRRTRGHARSRNRPRAGAALLEARGEIQRCRAWPLA